MKRTVGKRRYYEKHVGNYRYIVERFLGEGGFCVVLRARNIETGRIVAIKRIDKSKEVYSKFQGQKQDEMIDRMLAREMSALKELNHVNIARLIESVEEHGLLYMILEYADGGDLYNAIMRNRRISERISKSISKQVIMAVDYMHDKGFIHRDIKAENVLFVDKNSLTNVKITDFGLTRVMEDKIFTNCGTFTYSSPELLRNKVTREGYNYKVDNWAIGVLIYFMISGKLPYNTRGNRAEDFLKVIKTAKLMSHPQWNSVSSDAKIVINKLLEHRPIKRIELCDALELNWFGNANDSQSRSKDGGSNIVFPRMEAKLKRTLALTRWRVLFYLIMFAVILEEHYHHFIQKNEDDFKNDTKKTDTEAWKKLRITSPTAFSGNLKNKIFSK